MPVRLSLYAQSLAFLYTRAVLGAKESDIPSLMKKRPLQTLLRIYVPVKIRACRRQLTRLGLLLPPADDKFDPGLGVPMVKLN